MKLKSYLPAGFVGRFSLIFSLMLLTLLPVAQAASGPVQFDRDIRPILSENCFACHGPDEGKRKGKLRFDTPEGPFAKRDDGKQIIVRGKRAESELYRRITTADADNRMPLAKSEKFLTPAQIELLGKWIDEGAPWQMHWAFVPPKRPEIPAVKNKSWPKNPIDHFVLARLEKQGLVPNGEADKQTLIRRASLDLSGLPPKIEEVDAFLADPNPDAYDKMVDRLLDSAEYGEHMARYWLDAARYADTHGFHIDADRSIWPYRDWVIHAFNRNMPFDEFTIEQLAGDLLPNPTLEQRIATGFDRCNMTTGEGGAIEDEYLVKYAIDRTDTTATVWLGLTAGCAQCHDHKFDPIKQKEFYRLYSFFHNVAENGLDGNAPNPAPFLKVPAPEQAEELALLSSRIQALQAKLDRPWPEIDKPQEEWQSHWAAKLDPRWTILDPSSFQSRGGAGLRKLEDKSILAEGKDPETDLYEVVAHTEASALGGLRLEALTDPSLPHHGAGRADNGNFVLSEFEAEVAPLAHPDQKQTIKFAAAFADYSQPKFEIAKAIDGDAKTGWAVDGNLRRENREAIFIPASPLRFSGGMEIRVRLRFEGSSPHHAIGRFRLAASSNPELLRLSPSLLGVWQAVGPFHPPEKQSPFDTAFAPEKGVDLSQSYDQGRLKWAAKPEFTDGQAHDLAGENAATYLFRLIEAPSARKLNISLGSDDAIKVWFNKKLVLERNVKRAVAPDQEKIALDLAPGQNELLLKVVNYTGGYAFYFKKGTENDGELPTDIAQIFARSGNHLSAEQSKELRDFYRRTHSPEWQKMSKELAQVQEQQKQLDAKIPTTMVMQERTPPRDTFLLIRGEYDRHGEKVTPGLPSFLPPLPHGAPTNRLGLALWLVDPSNPLTARVTVNRLWSRFFGAGIVRTVEDFGTQGERPTHPELLDWLATEFIHSGWNVKYLNRLIVTSATYRQSSRLTPLLREKDPQNLLLARGARYRMDAEMIRDNALAISGLLIEQIGGHSVKPYDPPGLWKAVSYGYKQDYVQDHGPGLYRRSLYTFWKRQSPPASLTTLDAPSRETCVVRRQRTNTPLQALLLMNDPQYVEAARVLAERIVREAGPSPSDKIRYAFELAIARKPDPAELQILAEKFQQHLRQFQSDPASARKLVSLGESRPGEKIDPCQLAAWATITSIILNLDETITKG